MLVESRTIVTRMVWLDECGLPIPGTETVWYAPSPVRPSWPSFAGWQHSRGLGRHRRRKSLDTGV